MRLDIAHDFPAVKAQLARLQRDVAGKALPRALNRTIEQGRTSMSREIREEFNIKAAKVNKALRIKRASAHAGRLQIEAALESPAARGRSLNLINFAARQTTRGVTFKVKKAGARSIIPGAFIANAGRTVFIRVGKDRLPIEARQTIDVPQMFNTRRVNSRVVQFLVSKFPGIFEHEVKFYTEQLGKGGA